MARVSVRYTHTHTHTHTHTVPRPFSDLKSFLKHVHTLSENAGLEAVKAMSSGSAVSVTGWSVVVCLFVCVCERERERVREYVCERVSVCVCV